MMHSNAPDNLLQFRGNRKWSYYDNSGQVVGQPTVQCIMLNTAAEPFNNATLRKAMATAINRTQYAKVIDKGIDAPMNGLFLPGSEYYTKTAYPTYNPSGAAKLVKQVQQQTGKPAHLLAQLHERPGHPAGRRVPAAGLPAGGHEGEHQHHRPVDDHQRRAGRHLPGHAVAPVRRGRPRPQLRVVDHAAGLGVAGAQHGPQRRPPHPDARWWPGGPPTSRPTGSRTTSRSTSTWPRTSPTCGWPATPGPWWPAPTCRTSPTRRRCRAPRPSPSTKACSGRRRSGCR